jgi:hypothetical protein
MPHRNTVANGNRIELERYPARLANRLLDNLGHFVEMDVPGDYFAKTVGDGDKGLIDVGVAYSAGVQQSPVRRPLKTFLYCIACHIRLPFKRIYLKQSCYFNDRADGFEEKIGCIGGFDGYNGSFDEKKDKPWETKKCQ